MNYLRKSGLSGSSLKIIALISMLIDHTGAVLVLQMIRHLGGTTSMTLEAYQAFMSEYSWLISLYDIMRLVGRLAFPLFCFLLVEGFLHTRHLSRYIRNLGIFALISEPCFDLALHNCLLEFSSQNVFFTLFLGILTLCGIRQIEERLPNLQHTIALILKLAVIAVGCLLALWLKTDYDAYGILCISLMYLFRAHRELSFGAGCVPLVFLSSSQFFSFLGLSLIWAYNGKRGLSLKYIFYAFYPVHLLLLHLITILII